MLLRQPTRTSNKIAYVSPTRGAQGNALKTVLAIPYVLSAARQSVVRIQAQGIRHNIEVSLDQVAKRPQIIHTPERMVKKPGTLLQLSLDRASSQQVDRDAEFLPKLLADYALFNPHATFHLIDHGTKTLWKATTPGWRKWLPTDPTSAHWYNLERFEDLIGAYISKRETRLVRDFVSEFRGLSSTVKRKEVCAGTALDRARLDDLVSRGKFDRAKVARLLRAMQESSTQVKPESLGILGREHFEKRLNAVGNAFRYARMVGIDDRSLPFCVEVAFALTDDETLRGQHVGLNWAVPLKNPLNEVEMHTTHGDFDGLSSLLAHHHIDTEDDPEDDPVCFVIHLISPRFDFLDRGKGSVALPRSVAESLSVAILKTTKEWAAIKKKEYRQQRRDERERERYQRAQSNRMTIKEAAWAEMSSAYKKASGNGRYPAHGRQIYYAARGAILEMTSEESLRADYFTQTLLPDYLREHPDETAEWDVVYDARGHFFEPHTGREVPLGTIAVREYLNDIREPAAAGIPHPNLSSSFPTVGPLDRYGAVLLIEKEGFGPLLERARFPERYDLAIMSSKGMNTTAARKLVDHLPGTLPIFVLHDFDKAGFSIFATLTQDNRRYSYSNRPRVIDLGLRLNDVKKWKLQAEDVHYGKSNPKYNLESNGATPQETAFLCDREDCRGWHGKRVELNAFMSDQFVEWLDAKLKHHSVRKVIPKDKLLEAAYRRHVAIERFQANLDKAHEEAKAEAMKLKLPRELRQEIERILAKNPAIAWDEAMVLAHRSFHSTEG